MKWVKKGGYIRLCDDNTAEKLLRAGFEPFEPNEAAEADKPAAEPKKKASKKSE